MEDTPINNKVNNCDFFKILDVEYNKILYYENVFYLNLAVLNNHTEIMSYLKKIYSIAKLKGIDNEKKIIILNHLEACSNEEQKYIAFMIDRITSYIGYIFLTTAKNKINNKITSSCANIYFKPLDETQFINIFKFVFSKTFNKKYLGNSQLKKYYKIYLANNYNLGNTISQIKYNLSCCDNTQNNKSSSEDDINKKSLLCQIVSNFIKKKLVLSTINSSMEIRKFLYTMVSLNMDMTEFVKEVVKQLITKKIDKEKKFKILENANQMSGKMKTINKEIILLETFFYNIIVIIYS